MIYDVKHITLKYIYIYICIYVYNVYMKYFKINKIDYILNYNDIYIYDTYIYVDLSSKSQQRTLSFPISFQPIFHGACPVCSCQAKK